MNLSRACLFENAANVAGIDTAARHNHNPVSRRLHQTGNCLRALHASLFAARGQNSIRTRRANIFQRAKQICRHIECTVKSDIEWLRRFDQFASAHDIHPPVSAKYTEHDSSYTPPLEVLNVPPHDLKLICVIAEVAAAWPDHHVHRDRDALPHCLNESAARRDASLDKPAADFDASGPTSLSGDGRSDRIDTHLD
jgi:hypothetical protein